MLNEEQIKEIARQSFINMNLPIMPDTNPYNEELTLEIKSLIEDYIEGLRAEFRLYPDIYSLNLSQLIIEHIKHNVGKDNED